MRIDRRAPRLDHVVVPGTQHQFTIDSIDGYPDLTGYTAAGAITTYVDGTAQTVDLDCAKSADSVVVSISAEVTAALPTLCSYEVHLVDGSGNKVPVLRGDLYTSPGDV